MKIDLQSQLPVYRKNTGKDAAAQAVSGSGEVRRDVVDIHHGATNTDKQMVSLKASVHSHVNAPTDSERLAGLQARVRDGEYHVSTANIVNAMLGMR